MAALNCLAPFADPSSSCELVDFFADNPIKGDYTGAFFILNAVIWSGLIVFIFGAIYITGNNLTTAQKEKKNIT